MHETVTSNAKAICVDWYSYYVWTDPNTKAWIHEYPQGQTAAVTIVYRYATDFVNFQDISFAIYSAKQI